MPEPVKGRGLSDEQRSDMEHEFSHQLGVPPEHPDVQAAVDHELSGRVSSPERCDSCGAEGFRLNLSPDGEAQVCDGCLDVLMRPPHKPGRGLSSHGEWDKAQQRYEDGCKSDAPEHYEPGRGLTPRHQDYCGTHEGDRCTCPVADAEPSLPRPDRPSSLRGGAIKGRTLSRSTCVCGHVAGHHEMMQNVLHHPCYWRGCGCPNYVTTPEDPVAGRYELTLTEYEAANLMQLVDAIYRTPHDKERVPADTPVSRFNSGDWIGQLHWKLQAEVGDEYPCRPNPIWMPDV